MAQILVPLLISAALSALSYFLLKKPSQKNPIKDEKPATVASRGTFIPSLIGRRRLGAVVGWVGGHTTGKRTGAWGGSRKGSGGKKQKVTIHNESGWHILCVGPAFALHRILVNGKKIWKGPIYRATTPSGSTIDAGGDGEFRIYWGEPDQPIDTYLAGKIDVSSRWPYLCYVLWDKKELGQQRQWPVIDYEIEVHPEFSTLTDTPPWTEPGIVLNTDETEDVWFIEGVGGTYGDDIIVLRGKHTKTFEAGQVIKLEGNVTNADGDRTISSVAYNKSIKGTILEITTSMTTDVQTWFPSYDEPTGTVTPYTDSINDGANPAHVLDQLLFEPYPHGLGLAGQPDIPFNSASLEALGTLSINSNEGFLCSLLAKDGEEASGVIAGLMQDLGAMLRFNNKTGLFEFTTIRTPVLASTPHANDGMILPPEPEIAKLIGDRLRDKLIFKFSDRENNFRDSVIIRDDDGAASLRGHVKSTDIGLPNIIDKETAVKVVERRAQEEQGNMATVSMSLNREARALLPGDVLTIDDIATVLRVMEKQLDPLSSKTKVDVILDFYGVTQSAFEDGVFGGEPPIDVEVGGDQFTFLEIPAYLNREQEIEIVVPRIRADEEVTQGTIHLSRDDSTYINAGIEGTAVAGGQLAEAIALTDPVMWDEGPQILVTGPDIGIVEDLSGDDLNWRLGRQLVVIGEEIFFLQKVTSMGSDLYRLDGLIRARYDTLRAAHAAGEYVYIFPIGDLNVFADILLIAGKALYVKSQPETTEALALSDIEPINKTLVGKGIGPVIPANLRTTNYRNDFATGANIPLRWSYRSTAIPKTGAGLQGAGEPISPSPVQGEFLIRIYDSTGVSLKREVTDIGTDRTWTYTNANLVSDFGSEPASFVVRLTNVVANLESGIVEELIVRV